MKLTLAVRDIVLQLQFSVCALCLRTWLVHACIRPDLSGLGHNLYIYAWILKLFGTVVLFDE